jgi:hypothetical protein
MGNTNLALWKLTKPRRYAETLVPGEELKLPGQNADQSAPHGDRVPVWVQKAVVIVE